MTCPQCGEENSGLSKFCAKCGHAFAQQQDQGQQGLEQKPVQQPIQQPDFGSQQDLGSQQDPSQQQGFDQQQGYQAYNSQPYQTPGDPGEKEAKTSLICGIIGIVTSSICCCIPIIGIALGIVAWIQGKKAKELGNAKASTGFVLGIIAVAIGALAFITWAIIMIVSMATGNFEWNTYSNW
ncbi:MAG: zinc ribbon domain-containing protein [Peptococcaceae bacterium]|nr:zinc ribbon domain-containing protein [Peptococcaceae bacterium]